MIFLLGKDIFNYNGFVMKNIFRFHFISCFAFILLSSYAYAACTSPAGVAGSLNYDDSTKTRTICDGTNWKNVGEVDYSGSGARTNMQVGNDSGSCTSAKTGRLRYNSTSDLWEYCSGTTWKSLFGTGSANLYCWGANANGQLGDGTTSAKSIPTAVTGNYLWSTIKADIDTCAVSSNGLAYCWGADTNGRMGNGSSASGSAAPYPVQGGYSWQAIDNSITHGCGIRSDGSAYCWGSGANGRLGQGSTSSSEIPVAVSGGYTWTKITAGGTHSCGIRDNGSAYCWGMGNNGRLGTGNTADQNVPTIVSGSGWTWIDISAGDDFTCGIRSTGAAYCWGNNTLQGHLGDGTSADSTTPSLVTGGHLWSKLNVGHAHTCAIKNNGNLYCWGAGANGRLGNNATGNQQSPVSVSGAITNWTEIDAGDTTTCGIANGTAYCWGEGTSGALGNGGTSQSNVPATVSGGYTWLKIASGQNYGCGVVSP